MIAFGFYNIFFLAGNWAYVQRYTIVKNPKAAKEVGVLFGCLYGLCAILWMLPPMIYRVLNPDLTGLGDEGAYLLMCKAAMPSGLLGLMLGGMIFATASSLNATLNISAGVFTNDIYKRLKPKSTQPQLINVARISTIGFGVLAIIIALLVPLMGGIVNVVISVAALTGVPLYMPIIWTLFSKRLTGRSVLLVTLSSLVVNIFFKFVSPALFDFGFNRAQEMIVGVAFPFAMLLICEIYYAVKGDKNADYERYVKIREEAQSVKLQESDSQKEQEAEASSSANNFGVKVIGIGISIAGVVIATLGGITPNGKSIVICVGSALLLLGLFILSRKRKK